MLVVAETEEGELLTVFEQMGCVNEWETVWSERVEGFGEGVVKRVVGVRWLGEGRKVSCGGEQDLRMVLMELFV